MHRRPRRIWAATNSEPLSRKERRVQIPERSTMWFSLSTGQSLSERNEMVPPLSFLHRRFARPTETSEAHDASASTRLQGRLGGLTGEPAFPATNPKKRLRGRGAGAWDQSSNKSGGQKNLTMASLWRSLPMPGGNPSLATGCKSTPNSPVQTRAASRELRRRGPEGDKAARARAVIVGGLFVKKPPQSLGWSSFAQGP
ncbi:uncharacterized protein CCOS01_03772 [Colletotrichum costaricense]|uniref:Uncharacterized protein n=1 Tax=Colletotrichum costaricense TaxID=1209916 RepID=A0AAI9Z790_9PEZI|nr:uncharacterized protein CCOS01_03772 [Colletotrichum costaricense]KAK1535020.1 hypothetical protein CCOS01_03772 [Colletotrichum costaricense]